MKVFLTLALAAVAAAFLDDMQDALNGAKKYLKESIPALSEVYGHVKRAHVRQMLVVTSKAAHC